MLSAVRSFLAPVVRDDRFSSPHASEQMRPPRHLRLLPPHRQERCPFGEGFFRCSICCLIIGAISMLKSSCLSKDSKRRNGGSVTARAERENGGETNLRHGSLADSWRFDR